MEGIPIRDKGMIMDLLEDMEIIKIMIGMEQVMEELLGLNPLIITMLGAMMELLVEDGVLHQILWHSQMEEEEIGIIHLLNRTVEAMVNGVILNSKQAAITIGDN